MRGDTDEIVQSRRFPVRASRIPLWRRLVTLAVAVAFTVVMMALGLMRHGHFRHDTATSSAPTLSRSGSNP